MYINQSCRICKAFKVVKEHIFHNSLLMFNREVNHVHQTLDQTLRLRSIYSVRCELA